MPDARQRCGPLRGASPAMQEVYKLITRCAPTDVTVCLSGESGTGKEMVARVLHQLSPRRDAPFVTVNCGAINGELAESLLFGHERGSFTGAERTHRGIFEQAGDGTLFLDEVTEMPLELQVKLLRVLEGGSLVRIGGETPITLRARVICATNRAPERAVNEGQLRKDLWYRLNVFPIALPPLRERDGDITLLGNYFLQELNVAREVPWRWHRQAVEALEAHWWPGNVRELKNTVYRSVLLAQDEEIRTIELIGEPGPRPPEGRPALPAGMIELPLGSSVAEVERLLILATLAQCKGNKQSAANRLGVSLKRLYNRLNSYNRANAADS
jgi:DNA-binding NtrC family response regulator